MSEERYIVVRKSPQKLYQERLARVMDAFDRGGLKEALEVIRETSPRTNTHS